MKNIKSVAKAFSLSLVIAITAALLLPLPKTAGLTNDDIPRITEAKAAVKLNKTSITMFRYHDYQLKMKNTKKTIKWKSKNNNVATVDAKGIVTAVNEGTAKITATVAKKTYTCKVTVVDYDADYVLAAYGYQALMQTVPDTSTLRINEVWTGSYVSNQKFAYFDCVFTDKAGEKQHVYAHIYQSANPSLSYLNVTTTFYTEQPVLRLNQSPMDSITANRSEEISLSKVKKIASQLFSLEKISVTKGQNFDAANAWIIL